MATFKVGYVKGKYKKGDYIGKWGAGYYWSHIDQLGFDWFLQYMLNAKRTRFASRSSLKKGDIIIGNSSGHTYAIVDSNTQAIAEANDWYGDSIKYGRAYVDYDPYYVYRLPWTEDEIDAFLYNLKAIAEDNSYYYSHNNSLGNYNYYNAKGLDCCTYISLALYITLGWTWSNQTYQNANYQYIYVPNTEKKDGLQDKPEADGRWAYYTNGKVDTSVTGVYQAGIGLQRHILSGNAVFIGKAADAAAAVAAHFTPGAVGIVKMQAEIRHIGMVNGHKAVGTVDGTKLQRQLCKIHIHTTGIHHHKIVARAIHIPNFHFVLLGNVNCCLRYQCPLLEERVARRAGCGVAVKGGVIDGCCAAYTTSVTFGDSFSSRRSLGAFGAINNHLSFHGCYAQKGPQGSPL